MCQRLPYLELKEHLALQVAEVDALFIRVYGLVGFLPRGKWDVWIENEARVDAILLRL